MESEVGCRRRRALALLALGTALAAPSGGATAETAFDAQAAVSHDSNLPRALSRADILSDSALNLAMSGSYYFAPGGRDVATLAVDAHASQFRQFHGMSNAALGGTASWRRKLGLGAFVPWARVSGSFAHETYGESIRNGNRAGVTIEAGKRLSERLELAGGGGFDRYRADRVVQVVPGLSGDAFSLKGRSLFGRADYALSESWLGFARVGARRGDVTASTRRDPEIFEYSSAVTPDPAFGPDYIAYRLTGTTWDFSAGVSFATTDRSSLNFTVTRALTYGAGGLDYQSTLFNAGFILGY